MSNKEKVIVFFILLLFCTGFIAILNLLKINKMGYMVKCNCTQLGLFASGSKVLQQYIGKKCKNCGTCYFLEAHR
jgi:hypothetical protein